MRTAATRTLENALRRVGFCHVAGCDEVMLAGHVVTGIFDCRTQRLADLLRIVFDAIGGGPDGGCWSVGLSHGAAFGVEKDRAARVAALIQREVKTLYHASSLAPIVNSTHLARRTHATACEQWPDLPSSSGINTACRRWATQMQGTSAAAGVPSLGRASYRDAVWQSLWLSRVVQISTGGSS